MKKTFKRFMVVMAIIAVILGGMVTINSKTIDPPIPPGCITLSK